ncbi:MAG: DUF2723 domain-containing protein [Bacteroidales bacterium]|nr:DUF2723 domain-containing protein [Bacteroidales bacterium]
MFNYRKLNIFFGWFVFLVAAVVYLVTLEPTTSLWDCGEFIASAYKLQVGHPPGAPFFMLMGRFFSIFAPDPTQVAKMINAMSALVSAFTVAFLFWTITHLVKKFVAVENEMYTPAQLIAVIGSGLVGSLAYTFSDTFWFSAVEGEVYASSSLFTALVFWAILKWENEADKKYANRWIILIAYLMGLSIGVHLLNLLAIPAIVLVYYFRKNTVTPAGIAKALIVSIVLLGSVMYIVIPGAVWFASRFELLFVNNFGMKVNSGVVFYLILLAGLFIYGIHLTMKKKQVVLNTILTGLAVILLGYSSYALIVVRSLANPPMDENNPETVFSLLSYLNREQYGDRPLFSGQYFNARPIRTKETKPTYTYLDGEFKVTTRKIEYEYDKRFLTFFPRMWSSGDDHIQVYLDWAGIKESDVYFPRKDANGNILRDNAGNVLYDRSAPKKSPSFAQNLKFFFKYQVGHMYVRYFLWNFVGRQNDQQGHGGASNGNWISGIDFIDSFMVGKSKNMPEEMAKNPSRNTYFFLPFLLGLLGLLFHLQKDVKNFWVVMFLFVLTGLAIVVYLNQTPLQPRERDYAYAGSFYAFAIWIGIGVYGIFDSVGKKLKGTAGAFAIVLLCLVAVPGIMARENWDDHDRSGRYTARDIARNYLNSCAPNAILFTNGDNDTFPLWYVQEVEGIRTDVRVVNLMLLNMDWYIDGMKLKAYESDTLPITISSEKYLMGTRDHIYVTDRIKQYIDIKELVEFASSEKQQTKVQTQSGHQFNFIPTRKFRLPVDSVAVLANGTVKPKDAGKIVSAIEWDFSRGSIGKSELIVLDILAHNNWVRPVYYVSTHHEGTLGLENYLQLEGFAYRLVPIYSPAAGQLNVGRIDSDILYENLMNKFEYGRMNEPDVYLDDFHVRTLSIVRLRNRFARLASQLLAEGKTDKAVEVLDRVMELAPHEKVPFDNYVIQIADTYFQCGQTEKALAIINSYAEICEQIASYYINQNRKIVNECSYEIRYNLQMMQNMGMTLQKNGQKEPADKITGRLNELYQQYTVKL